HPSSSPHGRNFVRLHAEAIRRGGCEVRYATRVPGGVDRFEVGEVSCHEQRAIGVVVGEFDVRIRLDRHCGVPWVELVHSGKNLRAVQVECVCGGGVVNTPATTAHDVPRFVQTMNACKCLGIVTQPDHAHRERDSVASHAIRETLTV